MVSVWKCCPAKTSTITANLINLRSLLPFTWRLGAKDRSFVWTNNDNREKIHGNDVVTCDFIV